MRNFLNRQSFQMIRMGQNSRVIFFQNYHFEHLVRAKTEADLFKNPEGTWDLFVFLYSE